MNNGSCTRKGTTPIKVYCLPEEKARIKANASKAGVSTACFLREIGQEQQIDEMNDRGQLRNLHSVNGDLERLCQLLEQWVTDDQGAMPIEATNIQVVLSWVQAIQGQISDALFVAARTEAKD